jgi:hypothetical protein
MATLSSKMLPAGVATLAQGALADTSVQPNDSPAFDGLTVNGNAYPSAGALSNRNKIINGGMVIDQRLGSASSVPAPEGYGLDRWSTNKSGAGIFNLQQSADGPPGFTNSLLLTSTTASTPSGNEFYALIQYIEGYNCAELAFGTANARSVTLSFWVKSSVIGTYGGSLRNNGANRSYPFTYVVSSASVWEYKTITIPGDITGTWLTSTGRGVSLAFSLGASGTILGTADAWASANNLATTGQTNWIATGAATFRITGVQLEVGDTATPFEYRSFGQELALCQRYYFQWVSTAQSNSLLLQAYNTTSAVGPLVHFPVTMRAVPTSTATGSFVPFNASGAPQPAFATIGNLSASTENTLTTGAWNGSSGLVAGNAVAISCQPGSKFKCDAEL